MGSSTITFVRNPVEIWKQARAQQKCFHGLPFSSIDETGQSFITGELIDLGRRKMFECKQERGGCGKRWIV